MKIIHSFGNKVIKRDSDNNISFLLSNKLGSYCHFSTAERSRYHGVFFNENSKMYKVIDDIRPLESGEVAEIVNNFSDVKIKRKDCTETFLMPYGYNSFIYCLDKEKEVEITLDVRESYNSPEFGRFYEVFEEDNRTVIKYRQENEFECYLVISSNQYKKTESWFEKEYIVDIERNSPPFKKYVFSALKIKGKEIVFSFSRNKEKALEQNRYILKNLMMLETRQKNILSRNIDYPAWLKKIKNKEIFFAYLCAQISLYGLIIDNNNQKRIFAGLPWFFQFWARDELISVKALILMKKHDIAKEILKEKIGNVKENGIFINNNEGDKKSADAMGWLFKRTDELKEKFSQEELNEIKKAFTDITDICLKKETINSFVINKEKETWMDSLARDGVRLEIQALRLAMYNIMHKLTNKHIYYYLENKLKNKAKERLWNKKCLYDGINDPLIRPNIFIAYYVYHNLLHKMEWITCFHRALQKLWCDWGGVSTIGKNSQNYCRKHTGEITKSYHNGDSWFWVNNLAAITMYGLEKKVFHKYISKIVEASTKEILWSGTIANHSELSSAEELRSEGCPVQAWSAAMYIEMINELFS